MKFSSQVATLALAVGTVNAFPHMAISELQTRAKVAAPHMAVEELQARAEIAARASGSASGVPFPPDPAQVAGTFDAKAQYVSNTGKYAFVAPGANDMRGPCPGLNAMANHGYIPSQWCCNFKQGTYKVFGMGTDLAGFLAVYGGIFDGDITSWSIGGPTGLVGLGGTGLIGSHNKYEADVSPIRPDLYEYGNNYKVNWDQWTALYNKQSSASDDDANYNLAVLQEFRNERFMQSTENNPYFFNGPFSGVLVQPAAYTFIYRFMANKSAEHPDGVLNKNVLKAFYGVTENSDGSFSGGLGHEYIPDNWYKRAIGDEYTIPFFLLDVLYEASVYPKFLSVGGNTGKTNTFTPVDIANLTGGVYNLETLTQGNNLFCFGYQSAENAFPDPLTGIIGTLSKALSKYAPAASAAIANLGCPQLATINEAQLEQFPGYVKGGNAY